MKNSSIHLAVLAAGTMIIGCGTSAENTPHAPVETPALPVPSSATSPASNPLAVTVPSAVNEVADPPSTALSATRAAAVGQSVNGLASAIYGRMSGGSSNLVFSPASIHGAFAMTTLGAAGETASELQHALFVPAGDDARLRDEGALQQTWNAPRPGRTFRVVNRLFGERTMHFEEPYLALLRESFASPLEPTDFRQGFAAARTHINDWVATSTEQRILDLLPVTALDASTSLVLVNAVYLDAHWAEPFEANQTSNAPFNIAGGAPVNVPMMRRRGDMRLAEVEGAQIVELPYEGGDLAMRFILPPVGNENAWVTEAHLASPNFAAQEINLLLPKFRIEPTESVALRDHMQALGVQRAFNEHDADFTAIATFPNPEQRLYISQAFHRAFIRVDESGTEAAAATAVVMARGAGMPLPVAEVRFDRPFLFQLVDVSSGATLFLGRVTNPS